MAAKKCFVVLFAVLAVGNSAFVDTLNKCSVKDSSCHKDMFQRIMKDHGKTGIPELNLPPFDPVALKDITLPVLDIAELTVVEGTLKGLRNCIVNSFTSNLEKGRASMEITCDLTMKGRYKAFSSSPLIKQLLGGDTIHGDGNAKIKVEKLNLKINFNYDVVQRNGDYYIKCKDEKLQYKYDILGKVAISADHLYLGEQDASELITGMLNQNWKVVMQTAGGGFMDRAMSYIKTVLTNFFDNVPCKYYFLEDMSQYVSH